MKEVDRPVMLSEVVVNAIRDAILHGEMLPGDPMREVEISKSLNISRGVVREALRVLEQEGLVEIFPYRGAFVTRLTPKKVKEFYTLRALLEPYAVRLAMENNGFSPALLEELKQLIDKMAACDNESCYAEMVEADMRFHWLISLPSQHSILLDMLKSIQSMTLLFILTTMLYRSDMNENESSHRAILDAITQEEPATVEAIVRKHIYDAGSSLITAMERKEQNENPR